ncbi:MAG: sulfurtransferase [Qipengyuania sp.]|jgi:thiosulfate/3-mercaptopyruvate sulfurtransferase|nr:sulfurtransferase [Qipengyuania sp.]
MDSLVSTGWLADHLGDADLVILDATKHLAASGRDAGAEFLAGHIPGARFLNLADFADPASSVGRTLPGPTHAAIRFSSLGLEPGSRVVLYDDSDVKTSARAWFILRGYGIQRVAILDGGLAKWRAEGRPLEHGKTKGANSEFAPTDFAGAVRGKPHMLANIASGEEQVIDARDAGRFTGETPDTVHELPGGHIPGARHLFFRDLYNENGTFKSDSELRAAFDKSGLDLERPIVTSCGSGVTASVLLFALHRLGIEDAALYDGSWSEWGADPATPKETGPGAWHASTSSA